ncbi:alpha-glucosidase family protein [Hyphococcus luteus]|uniref:Alpha-glucosidase n=1 Tax=Hyphococcus luteus TaxID=2058213 RepID=A0A2S7K9Y6_9PROT|nr:alpha-glucosidase family protein [Marinicaulis flavus]PQA89334.1 alpha-glucosidase [Marinicaulis flavus]
MSRHRQDSAPWPEGAVIYQIYPRSFRDSSGDGIGDLKGIAEKLDYVAALGVDAVWLSPFFTSPMRDFGYDVADYCDVDPIFGALDDFDALIAKAHSLGIKVIIDQVYSHTSDRHPWFQESRRDRANAKAGWYVWADPKPDGSPPNNWMAVFGGVSWEWDARRGQYYLHNFLASQPDLNLHNRDVQDALLNVTRFWLDRGVDGFRLDALNFAMHDPKLRDNPPVKRSKRKPARPFAFQEHRYNQSHADIPKFLERIRVVTDGYPNIFTVAEVVGPHPLEEMKAFTAGETHLTTAYNFDFLYADELSPALVKKSLSGWPGEPGEALPSWAFSNHDAPRCISRWAGGADQKQAAKLYLLLLMALRGHIFIYEGEELGLPQADVPFEALQDPEAIANWPETLGRDGARTPMPWEKTAKNAGFSSGTPWLPMDKRHPPLAVDMQEQDKTSVLHFAREAIALRRKSKALRAGALQFLDAPEGVLAFTRQHENETLACVFNLGRSEQSWTPKGVNASAILLGAGPVSQSGNAYALPALSGFIAI